MHHFSFLSFDNYSMVTQDVNIRENWVKSTWEHLVLFFFSVSLKLSQGLPWWLSGWRICLPMQKTRVQSLIREGLTHHGATKPQPLSLCSTAWESQVLSPCATTTEACPPWSPCSTRETATVRSLCTAKRGAPTRHNWRKAFAATQHSQG